MEDLLLPRLNDEEQEENIVGTVLLANTTVVSTFKEPNQTARILPATPLCSRHQIQAGDWVQSSTQQRLDSQQCNNDNDDGTISSSTKKIRYYDWIPDDAASGKCRFTNFTQELACQVFQNKTILIAGDSLSFEHYLSLVAALGGPMMLDWTAQQSARLPSTVLVEPVCPNNATVLFFQRSDDLMGLNLSSSAMTHIPDMVVLNRGAHYVKDVRFVHQLQHQTIPMLQEWQASPHCRRQQQQNNNNKKKCLLIWRTTVPGHPKCERFEAPLSRSNQSFVEELMERDLYSRSKHWHQFQHQNELAIRKKSR